MSAVADKVREIVATSFGVDATDLSDGTKARDVDGWDSLAHATLILRLQRVFAIRLDAAKANSAQDLGRLISLIEQTLGRDS
jgi:acyl carrier protein